MGHGLMKGKAIVETVTDDDLSPRCSSCGDYVEFIGKDDGPVCKSGDFRNCHELTLADVVLISWNELTSDDEAINKIWADPTRRANYEKENI